MSDTREIRFINSDYKELFRIPDGGRIVVTRPMGEMYPGVQEEWVGECRYIDEMHVDISNSVYHLCQFAEIQERIGSQVRPEIEPEMVGSYRIDRRTTVGYKVFKFGVNMEAVKPYATWQGYTDPTVGSDWGHYWADKRTAERDFFLRAESERTGAAYDHTTLIEPEPREKQRDDMCR